MAKYIGKTFNAYHYGHFLWTIKIIDFMGETGYFVTEVSEGDKTWKSNVSYGELKTEIKKGSYIELS